MNLIKELKENEKPFGLMSKEIQDKARKIGAQDFQFFSDNWVSTLQSFSPHYYTYRLRPDYVEEPEVVKCEIYTVECRPGFNIEVYDFGDEKEVDITLTPIGYVKLGYLYEDGMVSASPRVYKHRQGGTEVRWLYTDNGILNKTDVLTPTHVLFKGK